MSRLFTTAALKALTLGELFALHAQHCTELPATRPGSPAHITIADALITVRREIALRQSPKPCP